MYQVENSGQVLKLRRQLTGSRLSGLRVSRTVVFLGLTSLFTDISAEMIVTVLPLYLYFELGMTPLVFGVIDGLYLGAASIVRLVGGVWADRSRRHKQVAFVGYALSAVSRLALLVVGGAWTLIASVILLDRLGKGIRTAPRDALISLSSPKDNLATAFGVHRALDTTGAMIGPLIAFALLTMAPGAYDAVFVVSLCAAVVGLGILALFVQNRPIPTPQSERPAFSLAAVARLVRAPDFGPLLLVGGVLSLATMSDAFLYLTLQRRLDLALGYFPLLFVATALVFMLLAAPMGQLADRVGRTRVFVGGYALLMVVYALLLLPWLGTFEVVVALLLIGTYYAATEGVLMALASAVLPEELRTSGLALLTTATNIGRLVASIGFGLLWTWQGVQFAVACFMVGLGGAMILTVVALRRRKDEVPDAQRATT